VVLFWINANKPLEVEKTTAKIGTVASVIEASGKVQAKQQVDLAFSAGGKVVWVGVKKGDQVKAYQTLATMDQREVEKNIRNKLLDYMKTRWDFDQLQDDNDVRGNRLSDVAGLTSGEKRALEKSQFGLDQSVLDLEISNLAREQYYLMTPIAGVVVNDGYLVAGERLNSSTVLSKQIRIINPESIYFQINVDEADYAKVKLGQTVRIKLDSFPGQVLTGKVTLIGKEGVKKTGGSVQIPVDVVFDSLNADLVPELNGDVEIVMEQKSGVLTVDKRFVHKDGNKYSVNFLKNNKIISHPVTIGLTGVDQYEIKNGLAIDQEVVNEIKGSAQ
jgi:RND family efflux transporter MFP subunit